MARFFTLARLAALACFAGLGVWLAAAIIDLPQPALRLPQQVAAQLEASGVKHPVTAVLLNFRGYDTLLEIAVLLLALFGMPRPGAGVTAGTSAATSTEVRAAPPMLALIARALALLNILLAAYLLAAGSSQPGGAFQAGAVLAAAAVLLHLAGVLPSGSAEGTLLRGGLVAGFVVFLAAAAPLWGKAALLAYPARHAGLFILAIEAGLTLSLALLLGSLVLRVTGLDGETTA